MTYLILDSQSAFYPELSNYEKGEREGAVRLTAAAAKSLQSCPTLQPHRRQPTRLPHPWDFPGKSTGVGCHWLLDIHKKVRGKVAQFWSTITRTHTKSTAALHKHCEQSVNREIDNSGVVNKRKCCIL